MNKNIIPTINISSILDDDFNSVQSIKTLNKIKKACVNIGFFQVTGHGISQKNIKDLCSVGNRFFNSSKKIKENFHLKNGISEIKMFTEDTFLMM